MSTIYDVLVKRKHIDTQIVKHNVYQVVSDDLSMAIFQAGQRFSDDQWDVLSVFVANSNTFIDEKYEWEIKCVKT